MTPAEITALDAADPLAAKRDAFHIPEGLIYLDGNSLGALPRNVPERVKQVVEKEWGTRLIRGWNEAGWIDLPRRVGDKIARLIGAPPHSVIAADSTSINLGKALSTALALRPERRIILSDTGNFPTDLYVAQGICQALGRELKTVAPEEVTGALDESVAVLMLTEVDYRTGRLHDMRALTRRAHAAGALTVWDLAHSAGALPVDVTAAGADFAVGCGYKYLNGGPGAPAFIYVRPQHAENFPPFLTGWMGHAAPFAFELGYRAGPGIDRMMVGTPAILSLCALDAALDVWEGVDMGLVRAKSIALGDLFIEEVERQGAGGGLVLASPRKGAERGSQVSFHCAAGYEVMQALIAEGVIGDFRAPDIIRFGMTPLTVRYRDVADAAGILSRILREGRWKSPSYATRAKVT
jgi:kynureninase